VVSKIRVQILWHLIFSRRPVVSIVFFAETSCDREISYSYEATYSIIRAENDECSKFLRNIKSLSTRHRAVTFHETAMLQRLYIPWDSNVTTALLSTSLQKKKKKRVGLKQRLTWRHILSFTFMTFCWIMVGGYQCFGAILQAWSKPSQENDSSIL